MRVSLYKGALDRQMLPEWKQGKCILVLLFWILSVPIWCTAICGGIAIPLIIVELLIFKKLREI